jgi:hypothetical protein
MGEINVAIELAGIKPQRQTRKDLFGYVLRKQTAVPTNWHPQQSLSLDKQMKEYLSYHKRYDYLRKKILLRRTLPDRKKKIVQIMKTHESTEKIMQKPINEFG